MTIEWRAEDRQAHLHNGLLSVVMDVDDEGRLRQLHFGARLPLGRSYGHIAGGRLGGSVERVGEPIPFVVPTSGLGDFRVPALVAVGPDGSGTVDLRYLRHEVSPGKPPIDPLPATYVESLDEAETLTVTLVDEHTGLEVDVRTSIFAAHPAVARGMTIRATRQPVRLETAMSLSLELWDDDWRMLQLSGTWGRETHVIERPLAPGRTAVSSRRGASGPEHNPFVVLRRPAADETNGEALGASLVYSGNFLAEVEVEPFGTTRLRLGIDPDTFGWWLERGASFTTPEAVVVRSESGLGELSRTFHTLYGKRLARGPWRDRPRPIVLNSWEATYFDFDAERLLEIARVAADLGIELFVLDDGWFGHRDADDSSLGDWIPDRRKLPHGLADLGRRINDLGLDFGLWIEPEMVSPDSDLYRAHPDWAIGIPGRQRTESRRQLVLDLGRPEVVDHLSAALSATLDDVPLRYIKWDMNRPVTEPYAGGLPPDRQGEAFHRHMLGVYELYRRMTSRYPDVLFESCASGGGRFDPGMLAFAPQTWASDDTDAVERLAIQWGASLVYPPSAIAAHVSAVPNHQTGRVTPVDTRAAVAFFGVLGYELDPTRLDEEERARIRDQIAFYGRERTVLQSGRFHRLSGPAARDGRPIAWMSVADDRSRAVVGVYAVGNRPNPEARRVALRGLDPDRSYRVIAWPAGTDDTIERSNVGDRSGAELMAVGLLIAPGRHEAATLGEHWTRLFVLEGS